MYLTKRVLPVLGWLPYERLWGRRVAKVRLGTLLQPLAVADTGMSEPVRSIIDMGNEEVEAYVKCVDERRLLVEFASALLGRLLGLPVPEPVLVFVPAQFGKEGYAFGSIAEPHPNMRGQPTDGFAFSRLRQWSKLASAACFDEWIANCDRHPGNLLFDGRRNFWLIDHDRAMLCAADIPNLRNILFGHLVGNPPVADQALNRHKTRGAANSFVKQDLAAVVADIPVGPWGLPMVADIEAWLLDRRSRLVTLSEARIPSVT